MRSSFHICWFSAELNPKAHNSTQQLRCEAGLSSLKDKVYIHHIQPPAPKTRKPFSWRPIVRLPIDVLYTFPYHMGYVDPPVPTTTTVELLVNKPMLNETNEDIYTRRICSGRCSHIAVQLEDEIWIGIYTGLYTIAWIYMRKVRTQSTVTWHRREMRITFNWESLGIEIWEVWNAISMFASWLAPFKCQLGFSLTLKFSKHHTNCQMLLWQLGSICLLMGSWINSIFANSVILTNIATTTITSGPPVNRQIVTTENITFPETM